MMRTTPVAAPGVAFGVIRTFAAATWTGPAANAAAAGFRWFSPTPVLVAAADTAAMLVPSINRPAVVASPTVKVAAVGMTVVTRTTTASITESAGRRLATESVVAAAA